MSRKPKHVVRLSPEERQQLTRLRRNGPPDAQTNDLKPWLRQQWVMPPKSDAAFVANMEDVLAVYHRAPDESRPVVCVDEGGKQLIGDTRDPLPARPKSPAKPDHEYQRNGMANLFLAFEPLAGWRRVEATERKTGVDFAHFIRRPVDEPYPDAEKVVLVLDNRSARTPASLYKAFEPAEARRLCARLEWHYAPKHGSWRNVAECELSVLARRCLDRRIPDLDTLRREVASRERDRNAAVVAADWPFTTTDARTRLKRLYPVIETATSALADH